MYVRALALAALFLIPSIGVFADEPAAKEKFGIKDERPNVGTNIKKERVRGTVPFDKPYADLSPEQQATLKKPYVALGEKDEPPYPEQGTKRLYENIRNANDHVRAEGLLTMFVTISETGEPTQVEVYKTPDPKLSMVVAQIAMLTKFKPGVFEGKPSEMVFPIYLSFKQSR